MGIKIKWRSRRLMQSEELSEIELKFIGSCSDQYNKAIKRHIGTHKGTTFIDLLKFLYQSELGSHHMLDVLKEDDIKNMIKNSISKADLADRSLMEKLYGRKWVRIDLGAYKKMYGDAPETLYALFSEGKRENRGSINRFIELADLLRRLVEKQELVPLSGKNELAQLVSRFLIEYKRRGCPPLHHSKPYLENNPPYLVVSSKSLKLSLGTS